jgi:hypothetical protein
MNSKRMSDPSGTKLRGKIAGYIWFGDGMKDPSK